MRATRLVLSSTPAINHNVDNVITYLGTHAARLLAAATRNPINLPVRLRGTASFLGSVCNL